MTVTVEDMIPRIIHYCWFGGSPLPELAQKCTVSRLWKNERDTQRRLRYMLFRSKAVQDKEMREFCLWEKTMMHLMLLNLSYLS